MPYRLARHSDIPTIARVLADSFHDEQLNTVMCPFRQKYRDDYVRAWRRRVRERWWDYARVWLVYYIEDVDHDDEDSTEKVVQSRGKEVMVGVAEWERVGKGWEEVCGLQGWWDPRKLITPLIHHLTTLLTYLTHPDRSSAQPTQSDPNPLTITTFESAMYPFIAHHYVHPTYRQIHWSLNTLGVLPAYGGKGVGRELVSWGIERAQNEKIPAAVVGSLGKERFYGRCGFEVLVGYATDGPNNPLKERGVGGGCVMFTF